MSRRRALFSATAGFTSAYALSSPIGAAPQEQPQQSICAFTKPFNSLSFEELSDRIAEAGFAGIEAPIRRGGYIDPTAIEDRLPELIEALRSRGLELTVMASDIDDPNEPLTEKVLRTAAALGIERYRMNYLMYDLKRPVLDQLNEWRPRFRDLADMNHELGIRAVYQNHACWGKLKSSGKLLGAAIWDLKEVLEEIPVDRIGIAFDIRHATVEGGTSWPITFNMIRPHIDTVYVKDFRWVEREIQDVPLGTGQVNPEFFRLLADSQFRGPISLHEEYLDHARPELVPQHLAALKNDLQTLKSWLRT
ncbi:MAG: sugar phosphate isomerase/epimerase family protein [Pirellulaceae bacterium]